MYVIRELVSRELALPVFEFASMVDADRALWELRLEAHQEGCDPEQYQVAWEDDAVDWESI